MNSKTLDINKLSQHLFWDVDRDKISYPKHKEFLVGRILDYGLLADWKLLHRAVGLDEITEIAINLRDLDIKSASLISTLSNIPLEKFRCYTTKQSMKGLWVY
jgi:hypothetical protein